MADARRRPRSARTSRCSTAQINGQPHRLPRLGRVVAEAAPGARRDGSATTRRRYANVHRSVYQHRRPRPPSATRRPGSRSRRFISAPQRARGRVHQERHRGAQPRRLLVGPGQPARGRRRRAHPDGAPRQHRAVADAGRRARHRAALGPPHRRRPARPHRPRPAARRGQGVLLHRHVERARHHHPGAAGSPTPPTPPAPSPSSTPASTCPTCPPTCRPWAPTSSPSAATRCAARRASACCGAARSCSTPCRRSSAAAR